MNFELSPGQTLYFPPTGFEPFLPPYVPPRGRWVWIDDNDGVCDACADGVCSCVRPDRQVTCGSQVGKTFLGVDPAFEGDSFTLVTFTTEATGAIKFG